MTTSLRLPGICALSLLTSSFLVSACGVDRTGTSAPRPRASQGVGLTADTPQGPTLQGIESIPKGDTRCPAGGVLFTTQNSPQATPEQVVVCNGRDGVDGAAGRDGVDGAAGRDGVDGVAGRDGANGLSPLAQVVQVKQVSRDICPLGGYTIITFKDADGDGAYNPEKGDKDFYETPTPVCNASTGVRLLTENQWFSADEGGDCPAGGVISRTYGDLNNNGVVDEGDVLANATKICHRPLGASAGEPIVVTGALPAGDKDCPEGGRIIRSSRDQNGDGIPNTGDNNVTISKVCTNSMLDQRPRNN